MANAIHANHWTMVGSNLVVTAGASSGRNIQTGETSDSLTLFLSGGAPSTAWYQVRWAVFLI
jgi:hypothetical protein